MGIQQAKADAEIRVPGPGWRVTSRWFFSALEKGLSFAMRDSPVV
jgi:hypothetical protein